MRLDRRIETAAKGPEPAAHARELPPLYAMLSGSRETLSFAKRAAGRSHLDQPLGFYSVCAPYGFPTETPEIIGLFGAGPSPPAGVGGGSAPRASTPAPRRCRGVGWWARCEAGRVGHPTCGGLSASSGLGRGKLLTATSSYLLAPAVVNAAAAVRMICRCSDKVLFICIQNFKIL